jgi:hypothetical protein
MVHVDQSDAPDMAKSLQSILKAIGEILIKPSLTKLSKDDDIANVEKNPLKTNACSEQTQD